MDRLEYIKQHLTIPAYFNAIILPDMKDYYQDIHVDLESYVVTRCPFHQEKEGSFRYFPDTNSFYCYGCGRGGDVITMHKEHMLINHTIVEKFDKVEEFLYQLARDIGYSVVHATSLKEKVPIINDSTELLRFTVELNRLITYIKRKVSEPSKIAEAMYNVAVYRDAVLSQKVKADVSLRELKQLIVG